MSGEAMGDFITEAGSIITPASLWGSVTQILPLVGTIVGFVLGFTLVKRLFKGTSKGKLKM